MALPASGPLTISAIRTEINNSTTYSLRNLSLYSNKTSPDAMSDFYSYGSTFAVGSGIDGAFLDCLVPMNIGGYLITWAYPKGVNTTSSTVKLWPNGQNDSGFGQLSTQAVYCTNYSSTNNRVYAGGTFSFYGSSTKPYIVCLTMAGAVDSSFNSGGSGFNSGGVSWIYPLSSGKIMVGGSFTAYNGTTVNRLARLNSNGTLDTSFNSGGAGLGGSQVNFIIQDSSGRLLIGVDDATTWNGTSVGGIFRMSSEGVYDSSFNTGGAGISGGGQKQVVCIALDSNGKIYITGWFNAYNGVAVGANYARLNSDGTRDTGYSYDTGNAADWVSVGGNNLAVVTLRNNNGNGYLRRFTSTGSYDTSFSCTPNAQPVRVVVNNDNSVIFMGGMTTVNGTDIGSRNIAKVTSTGSLLSYS